MYDYDEDGAFCMEDGGVFCMEREEMGMKLYECYMRNE